MAFFGLRKPIIAVYDENTNTYSGGIVVGKAVSLDITPNYAEGSLYGDDVQVEYQKEFKNANVVLGTTNMPVAAASTIFGHEVSGTEVIKRATDVAPYVGVGTVIDEVVNGVTAYIASILVKVKFAEAGESFQTKGDSITFTTPSIEGLALAGADNKWLIRKTFSTYDQALAYVKSFLNVADQVATPVADVKGGTYDSAQSVELTCATAGATIYYTTNGVTPSADTGTAYAGTAISVSDDMAIKAIAVKTGLSDSAIMEEEYIIE